MMDHLAKSLGKDVEDVKKANLYKQGQVGIYQSLSSPSHEKIERILLEEVN